MSLNTPNGDRRMPTLSLPMAAIVAAATSSAKRARFSIPPP